MRYRELHAGQVITAGPRRVTEQEIIEFAERYDPQPFHVDPAFAQASRWKGVIASGWMTCGIAMQLAVSAVLRDSDSIGSPGVEQIKWPHPVRPGDEVRLRIDVLETRVSRSGSVGVVRWRWSLVNQADTAVLDLVATSLFELQSAVIPADPA